MFFALGQQTGTLQGRTQGEVQDDRTHGGGHAVYKGDAACNFGQRLCHGVFLTKDVQSKLFPWIRMEIRHLQSMDI